MTSKKIFRDHILSFIQFSERKNSPVDILHRTYVKKEPMLENGQQIYKRFITLLKKVLKTSI